MDKATKRNNKWTVRVKYIGFDGKEHRKRITADKKAECERMAHEFISKMECTRERGSEKSEKLTLINAARNFIDRRSAVLSPATIYGYRSILRSAFVEMDDVRIYDITREDVQKMVNNWTAIRSPKTVRNYYGFLCSVLKAYRPDFVAMPRLPRKNKLSLYTPSDAEVKTLIEYIKGTELEIPVLLAAFSSLRRSEICALCYEDIGKGVVNVNKAMVYDSDNNWVIKVPKTEAGYRTTYLPESISAQIKQRGSVGRITRMNPRQITYAFTCAVKAADLPHFRFHALRSYYASILHALGVPDKYIMEWGGWHDEKTLQQHYEKVMADKAPDMAQIGIDHFTSLLEEHNTP